jgi:hypothetical protein
MRPRPMNPHVACSFCELEKYFFELWRIATGAIRRSGDDIAEATRIVVMVNTRVVNWKGYSKRYEVELCGSLVGTNSAIIDSLSRGRGQEPLQDAPRCRAVLQ